MRSFIFVFTLVSFAAVALEERELTTLRERTREFYAHPDDPMLMWRAPDRYDLESGKTTSGYFVAHSEDMKIKTSPGYLEYFCRGDSPMRYVDSRCGVKNGMENEIKNSAIQPGDRMETLARTWLEDQTTRVLEQVRSSATSRERPWGGDYWKYKYGGISYRYKNAPKYKDYELAISAYAQPEQWEELFLGPWPTHKLAQLIAGWSPAEKYDLTVGDSEFTLTNAQKAHGRSIIDEFGQLPFWSGMCDGWSAASTTMPRPVRPVTAKTIQGNQIVWYPGDIEALLTLAWTNAEYETNGMGGRCQALPKPETFANGRLAQQECFDTNPASFHLALANLIGEGGIPVVMDSAYDAEVWNYPIFEYEFNYFSPKDPSHVSTRWEEVAVPYDDSFKMNDRFQYPLTRGTLVSHGFYDDSQIHLIVGVAASIVYPDLRRPLHEAKVTQTLLKRTTYRYDLELRRTQSGTEVVGGEWHSNIHPDFLWVVRKGGIPTSLGEQVPLEFSLEQASSAWVTKLAVKASQQNKVLCQVAEQLIQKSKARTDTREFRCFQ